MIWSGGWTGNPGGLNRKSEAFSGGGGWIVSNGEVIIISVFGER